MSMRRRPSPVAVAQSRRWFPVSHLARENVPVVLLLGGGPVKGVMRRGRRHPTYWVPAADGAGLVKLAPFAEPSLWRPEDEATWPDPLPAPAVLQYPPLPRPEARPRAVLAPAGAPPLPSAIAYSPAGSITLAECEARLLRALKTDRALPDTDRAKLRVRIQWPATAPEPGDYPPEISLRWQPFPEDVADYLVAMAWFAALPGFEKSLVRRRAAGASFARMAQEAGGRSDEWAKQQYVAALTRAWGIANGDVLTTAAAAVAAARQALA